MWPRGATPARLSYKEQRELEALPAIIEQTELEIATIQKAMSDGAFYQHPRERIAQEQSRLNDLEDRLAATYVRWEELDQRAN